MEKSLIKDILKKLLGDLLNNKIDKQSASKAIRSQIDYIFIMNYREVDEISYTYFTIEGLEYSDSNENILHSELIYLYECLIGSRNFSKEEMYDFVLNRDEPLSSLIPALKRQEIDSHYHETLIPEKFEYYNNYLFGNKLTECRLAIFLMADLGLETIVKLAPKELWEEALKNY